MALHLVTGGSGFIGSHITEALLKRGDRVRVFDNLSTGKSENLAGMSGELEILKGDLCDAAAVSEAVRGVDTIFHQAALASVPRSVDNPLATHEACVTGTVTLLDQARRNGVRRVVYAASSSAYGDSAYDAKREDDMPSPLSPYAAAKLACEQYCQAFYHSYGLETVCLRYFNVFGPRQDPNGPYAAVIPRFILRMASGQTPIIFGDGKQSRDFTYVANVVRGNLLASTQPGVAGKTYNMASGKSYSLLDLVAAINDLLGTNMTPVFEPVRVGDVRDSLADMARARRELAYEVEVDFAEGLRHTVAYYAPRK